MKLILYLHAVKWLQVLLFNTNNSIQHYSFVCTQLNGNNYYNVSFKVQFNISHLFPQSSLVNSFIRTIYGTLTGTTTPGLSGPGDNRNVGVLLRASEQEPHH